MIRSKVATLLVLLFISASFVHGDPITPEQFGAIPFDESNEAAATNSMAISKALSMANMSTFLIPEGMTYYVLGVSASELVNTTIVIEGALVGSRNISAWDTATTAMFYLSDSANISLTGTGVLDGQGFDWWVYVLRTGIDNRPHLFSCDRVAGITIDGGLLARNPAQYNFRLFDVINVVVRNITIWVDVERQGRLLADAGVWTNVSDTLPPVPSVPQAWALNTDGVDIWGTNALVENITVLNYDDVVAIKPSNGGMKYSQCSQNIVVRDIISYYGVGQTIGSVPPDINVACVRDVLFENVQQWHPLKGIYIKTNPGNSGSGVIQNIVYRNFTMVKPLWYPVWIGPQQECQPPFTNDTCNGCTFIFPISKHCATQPRINVTEITLQDIRVSNTWDLPGVILCDDTNPCSLFQFTNVTNFGAYDVDADWYCENLVDSTFTNVVPLPKCVDTSKQLQH